MSEHFLVEAQLKLVVDGGVPGGCEKFVQGE